MSIREHIRTRVRPSTYACEGCGKRYQKQRPNCPACGFAVRELE